MKKSLLILLLAGFAVGASAQKKGDHHDRQHSKDQGDNRSVNDRKYHHDDDDHDRGRHDKSFKKNKKNKHDNGNHYGQIRNQNGDRRYNRNTRGNRTVNNNGNTNGNTNGTVYDNGNQGNNVPAAVTRSFYNDYPRAKSVTWTYANGYWTANFVNGLFRPTATYDANGVRRN